MWKKFQDWAKSPFSADMSAMGWFQFIGLMLILVALWSLILGHLTAAIRTSDS